MKRLTSTQLTGTYKVVRIVPLYDYCNSSFVQYNLIPKPFKDFEAEFAHSKITIAEMAERCAMSPTAFKRKFAEYYGLSPHKWQLKQRLTRAADLLTTTDLLVKQICYECNFATPSHFIRSFKKEFGCTPERFRENCQ